MKKLSPIFTILLFIFSCDRGASKGFTKYQLFNSTPSPVEVKGYYDGDIVDSYLINKNSNFEKIFTSSDSREILYPPPFDSFIDSIVVVYCGSDSVTHLRSYDDLYFSSPIKNLFSDDDYEIESTGD